MKIIVSVLIFLMLSIVTGRADEHEKRKTLVLKDWTTQLLYDTTNACYEGTIRWVIMGHPSLRGLPPTMRAQRQMIVHCFCVMDKIKKEFKIEEYQKLVYDQEWIRNTFMAKAMECVKEEQTLPSFFINNKTIIPKILVPDGKTEDSQKESPDQQQEESNGIPETIFQG